MSANYTPITAGPATDGKAPLKSGPALPSVTTPIGLTSAAAAQLVLSVGANAVADVAQHPARRALLKLWAPVPWMLEAAIVLQLAIGDYAEAGVVALLLVTNAALGFFQEGRAQATLDALKSRLTLVAAVRRDGVWTTTPAAGLVAGDVVKLSLGSVVPADVRLDSGSVLIDQSMLTGESIAVAVQPSLVLKVEHHARWHFAVLQPGKYIVDRQ